MKRHWPSLITCLVLIVIALLIWWFPDWIPKPGSPSAPPDSRQVAQQIKVVIVEECEYVVYQGAGGGFTHKGNCSNPTHGGKNAQAQ